MGRFVDNIFAQPCTYAADARHRCIRSIRLWGVEYPCLRPKGHEGIHEANERAADGLLVRW